MEQNQNLTPASNWQTQSRGTNTDEYEIYVSAAKSLGWNPIKTFDEWIKS